VLDSVGPRVNDPGDLVQRAESYRRINEAERRAEPHKDMSQTQLPFGLN
jgi:hypothetical protein